MANISFPRDSRSCVITLSVRRGTRSPAECSQSPDIHYLDYRSIVCIRLYILLQGHSPPTQLHTHTQCQTDQSTDTQPTTSRATLPSLPSDNTRRTGTLLLKMCMSPTPRSIDLPLTYTSTYTTSNGVPVPHPYQVQRAGLDGPLLLQDFHLIDLLSHFDRERYDLFSSY